MLRRSPLLLAGLAVAATGLSAGLATVLAACGSFSATADDVAPDASLGAEDASDAHLAEAEPGADAATPDAPAPDDGGVDALTPVACDASFCEDFESGDLAAATARWGIAESVGGATAGVVDSTVPPPPRRFFHVSTSATTESYARLTHPLGAITSATTIDLGFQVRMMTASNSEIVAFNILDGSGTIVADLTIRASVDGTLKISWSDGGAYTSSPPTLPINDAEWHTIVFHGDMGGAALKVDGQGPVPVSGSPLGTHPQCLFSAGAYLLTNGATAIVDLDDFQLDVH